VVTERLSGKIGPVAGSSSPVYVSISIGIPTWFATGVQMSTSWSGVTRPDGNAEDREDLQSFAWSAAAAGTLPRGRVAERTKATVLKTVDRLAELTHHQAFVELSRRLVTARLHATDISRESRHRPEGYPGTLVTQWMEHRLATPVPYRHVVSNTGAIVTGVT
jgi:hypothetical protein